MIIEKVNGAEVLTIDSNLLNQDSEATHNMIIRRIELHYPKYLIIDLSEIDHINSEGKRLLIEIFKVFSEQMVDIALVCPSKNIRRAISISKLDKLYDVYNTLDEAFAKV